MALPLIQYFGQEDYNAHPQNYCAIQDQRGILYIGNNDGLLEFDGWNWRLIQSSNKSGIRCLAKDQSGIIFAGAIDDFGYISYLDNGTSVYKSLLHLLPDSSQNTGIIWKVFTNDSNVYFIGSEDVYIYNYHKITTIPVYMMPQYGFMAGKTLCLFTENGLSWLDEENNLHDIPKSEWLYENNILVPLELYDQYIFIGDISGIIESKTKAFPFLNLQRLSVDEKSMQFFENMIPYCATQLSNKKIAVGSLADGLIIINEKGDYIHHLNIENALADNTVIGLYTDNMGNTWVLLNNGINILFYNKPLSVSTQNEGIESAVMAIDVFHKSMFVGTYSSIMTKQFHEDNYRKLSTEPAVCWAFLKQKDRILASYGFEIVELQSNGMKSLYSGNTSYSLATCSHFNNIIFSGQDGLVALEDKGSHLEELFRFPECEYLPIRKIETDQKGRLWATSEYDGIFVYSFGDSIIDYSVQHLDTTDGLPGMLNNYMCLLDDRTIICSPEGLREAIYKSGKIQIIKPTDFEERFCDGSIGVTQIMNDEYKNTWVNTKIGIGKFIKGNGKYKFRNIIPIQIIPDVFKMNIYGSNLYIGSGKRLFTYSLNTQEKDYRFPVFIRKVILNNDSLLFNGNFTSKQSINAYSMQFVQSCQGEDIPEIQYKWNDISFFYAGFSYEKAIDNEYSFYLEGYDEDFSTWSKESKKEYTNLPEGEYTFHVKCRNIYGETSPESSYSFIIMAPWYRTIWAYIVFTILIAGSIFLIVRLNSMRLRKANIRLEKTVEERTAVIAHQKKEITDSIEYAGKIQKSVLPSKENLSHIIPNHFILNLPKDIVSGDFYWTGQQENAICFCVADCTGHGVPGAFMSMLGISSLNQLLAKLPNASPDIYLNELRKIIIESLHQKGESGENADGMDMAFCRYFPDSRKIEFAGAHNPMHIVRNGESHIIKGDKMPVGVYHNNNEPFTLHKFIGNKEDMLYLYSDGFADQFGGEKGKKYMSKRFREFLESVSSASCDEQREKLKKEYQNWISREDMEDWPRMDDVMVMGLRL